MFKSLISKIGKMGNVNVSKMQDSSGGDDVTDDIEDHGKHSPSRKKYGISGKEEATENTVEEEEEKGEDEDEVIGENSKQEEKVEDKGKEEEEEEDFFKNFTPATFLPFSPRGDVFASVNIIQASPSIRKQIVGKVHNYTTYLKLVKQEPAYMIEIHSKSGKRLSESLNNLESVKVLHQKKQILSVQFQMGIGVQVQFLHIQHMEYFQKIFEAVIQLRKNREHREGREKIEEEFRRKAEKLNPYVIDMSKVQSLISHLKLSSEEEEEEEEEEMEGEISVKTDFCDSHCDKWNMMNMLTFFNHVFVQLPQQNRFPTLLTYMKKNGFLKKEFISCYLIRHLVIGLQKWNRKEVIPEKPLRHLMEDDIFRNAIEREFILLRTNDGYFPMNRYTILRKITSVGEQQTSKLLDLSEITWCVNTSKRYLWDVEACRSMILSFLLIRNDVESHIKDLENRFLEKEREVLGRKIEKTCPWESSMRHVYINDEDWTRLLEDFNENEGDGLPLEKVSYRIFRRFLLNQIRMKRRVLEDDDNEDQEEEEERNRVISETYAIRIREASDEEDVAQLLHEMKTGPDIPTLVDTIEEHILLFSDSIFTEEEEELRSRLDNNESRRVIQKPQNITRRIVKEWENNAKMEFLMQSERKKLIEEKLLLSSLERKSMMGGKMTEFGCKLVLSIRKGTKVGGADRAMMLLLDRYVHKWGFFKYGWVHSNVMVGSLGLHWFSDSLVTATNLAICENLYKEIIALDCHCPLIVDFNNVFQIISSIALDIVATNLNYTYVLMKFWEKKGYLNCQEFTERLLESLKYTQFFPEVEEYISLLKYQLSKSPVHTEKKLRYVVLSKRTWKKFRGELEGRFEAPDKKSGKVFLDSHADIDDFYRLCCKVDPLFQLHHPGIYQLMKGFDRAMWMRLKNNIFDNPNEKKLLQPSPIGCTFTKDFGEEEIFEKLE